MEKILLCGCHKVRSDGNIFSKIIQRSSIGVRGIITEIGNTWNILNCTKTKNKYKQANIHGRTVRVSRLVGISFIPNPRSYPEVQHKNGNRIDNRVSNLKWGNQKHNANDRDRHGNTQRGENHYLAKLTNKKVLKIRILRSSGGFSLNDLAAKFSVSKKLILMVLQNKIWRHVK